MRILWLPALVAVLGLIPGCGGGSASPQVTTPAISLSPSTPPSVVQGSTLNITASVTGVSGGNGVTWSLSGVGSLSNQTSTSVTYNAPVSVSGNSTGTVTATSAADTSLSTSLKITVTQTPTPLALGTVSNITTTSCPPSDFYSAIPSCSTATISCPGTDDISVIFGAATPSGTVKGTILMHPGGGGRPALSVSRYTDGYFKAGYRIVDVEWPTDWELARSTGTENIKIAACRPATLLHYVYENIHGGPTGQGAMCAHGNSAGAGAMGYILAWYGAGSYLDKVLMTSGPVFGDLEAGCKVPNVPPITVCATGQFGCVGSQWSDFPQYRTPINAPQVWAGDSTCNNVPAGQSTTDASNAAWKAQSIVDGTLNASFLYPQTAISGWLCAPNSTQNNSAAQAQYYYQQIQSSSQVAAYSVNRVDSCTNAEDVWNGIITATGGSAFDASLADMVDPLVGCVKRH